jgi:integrase
MTDMPKPPYLTKDNKGFKLRRPVPKSFQDQIGKTQWVERLSGMPYPEMCQRARCFGVETDAELMRHRNTQTRPPEVVRGTNEPRFTLSMTELGQLKLAYFRQLEEQVEASGGYGSGLNSLSESEYQNLKEDAQRDHLAAMETFATAQDDLPEAFADSPYEGQLGRQAIAKAARELLLAHNSVHSDQLCENGQLSETVRSSDGFEALCNKMADAMVEHTRRRIDAFERGGVPDLQRLEMAQALNFAQPLHTQPEKTVGDLIDVYLDRKLDLVTKSRFNQYQLAARALSEEVGREIRLGHISREQCEEIAALFVRTPQYATRHYEGKSIREAAEAYEKQYGASAARYDAAQDNLRELRVLLDDAVDREWIEKNPCARVRITKPKSATPLAAMDDGYEPFTASELTVIFSAPLYTGCKDDGHGVNKTGPNIIRKARFWVPLIALFSGLRMQEILQLETSDIREDGGVRYICVNDIVSPEAAKVGHKKKLKTKNSVRDVPVHRELEKLGFFSHVEQTGGALIFPELEGGAAEKLSDNFSKRFRSFLRPTGVWVSRRKVFHSFRGTFNDALRDAEVPKDIREELLGWGDQQSMDRKYGKGAKLSKLHAHVNKTTYDELDLSSLYMDDGHLEN